MAAIGNLNDYVKLQMAEGLAKGSGGGTAGAAAEIAMGFGLAQQLMNQPGGLLGPQATPSAAAPAPAAPPPVAPPVIALLSPAEVAQALNVSEADVLTELTAGTLKGRKIGSAWRVSRAALEDFLRG